MRFLIRTLIVWLTLISFGFANEVKVFEFTESNFIFKASAKLSVNDIEGLVSFSKNDLLKFRNFGKKSLTELEDLVEEKNLHFGFDISKYNIENNEQ